MVLKIVNCLSKQAYFFENLTDNAKSTDLFYCFDIKLPEGLNDGEYEYVLYDDGVQLVSGILQIGDYVPERTSYNNENENGYIVYGE